MRAPMRVLMAATLHDCATGSTIPIAARGEGAVRITAVAAKRPRFWRNLPRMLPGTIRRQT